MPNTYTPIASTVLSTSASSISFTSIPATYTDLVLVSSSPNVNSSQYYVYLVNGTTSFIYSWFSAWGRSTSKNTDQGDTVDYMMLLVSSNSIATNSLNFMNYANTNVFKNILGTSRRSNAIYYQGGTWASTNAISSFQLAGTTFLAGSTFTLYGVKAA